MESNSRFPGLPSAAHLPAIRILLTEDAIKRAFIGFLKQFYKNRYEINPGSFQASIDNISQGGLVADGILRFTQTNGKVFTCAYESTSRDRIDEVRFTLNVAYFLWDCAAFGAVTAAIAYAVFFVTRMKWLLLLGWAGNIGLLLSVWLMGFLLWYFSLRGWRKYRYIYAIEQFKQYFADDQWIALGDDVFPSPIDPYLQELRSQCIYHGFGLALVDANAQVRILVSPSRLDFYGKDRRIVEWVIRNPWYQAVSQNVRAMQPFRPTLPSSARVLANRIVRPVQFLVWEPAKKFLWQAMQQPLSESNEAFERFMTGQKVQKWIFFLSLLLIGMLAWQMTHRKVEKKQMTFQDIRDIYGGQNPEDYPYAITGEPIPYQGGIAKQYAEQEEETPTIDLSGSDAPPREKVTPLPVQPQPVQSERVIGMPQEPCTALAGPGWVVVDHRFGSRLDADMRTADLRSLGFDAVTAPLYCVEKGKTGYVVHIGTVFPREDQARETLQRFAEALNKKKLLLPGGKPELKRLE
ncbi:MAG: hypothetical protein SFV52_15500 [Saprospiraceae bacterium]|nr:hypothetical protein [Saprospiraceae bacterium]